jgi:hypothetical protein
MLWLVIIGAGKAQASGPQQPPDTGALILWIAEGLQPIAVVLVFPSVAYFCVLGLVPSTC